MKELSRTGVGVMALLFVILAALPGAAAEGATVKPAVPVEPITAIIEAFRTHQVVALGEGTEGNLQGHAFRLSLIHDPRFAATVNDIVVEFGNSRYQDIMDRFVRGEDIPYDSLRRVWRDTTQPDALWDVPIYEEFYRAVREVNRSLPPEKQLRVLLGDPPINWDSLHRKEEYGRWDRDRHPAELVRTEVLAKGRRGLVLYGDLHFIRKNPRAGGKENEGAHSIVGLLENTNATTVFSIRTLAYGIDLEKLQPDVRSWPRPSLALLPGTVLGEASFFTYYPSPLVVGSDSKPAEPPGQRRPLRMEQQFDALLYLGPQSSIQTAKLSPKLCSDAAYMQMRIGRMTMLGLHAAVDRLKDRCALGVNDTEIPDHEAALTELVRATIRDAASGKTDPARFDPQSRERLVSFLQLNGPRFLGSMASLSSLKLLAEQTDGPKRVRRYRAVFAQGRNIIWIVGFSAEGKILSLDPRPE